MSFFFDRNVGVRIARMLDAFDAEHKITHQDDDSRFHREMKDTEIISVITSDTPKPTFITSDISMKKRADERISLRNSGLTVVFLRGGWTSHVSFHLQAVKILNLWPEIVKVTTRCREPTAFEIRPKAKKVDLVCKTSEL